MVDLWVPYIKFHQYGTATDRDLLFLFSAPARTLAQWAGVPRKGWNIRMLYQRWVTPRRQRDLARFWERAANPPDEQPDDYILGPTAITLALQADLEMRNGEIHLAYEGQVPFAGDLLDDLRTLADAVLPQLLSRLTEEKQAAVAAVAENPFGVFPEIDHDYVLEFAIQLTQLRLHPGQFVERNALSDEEIRDLAVALEALCRPALVVDGQHRLLGAAEGTDRAPC